MENLENKQWTEKLTSWLENAWRGIKAFIVRNRTYFYPGIIVFFLYMFGLYTNGVYPFGTKYSAASYDLSAQICPFIEHLFDVLDGKSSLTYSYAIAGGADIVGTFLYFFVSPFSFIFLILGDGMVAEASAFVMACKLSAIAVMGTWFAKKLFDGIPDYICVFVGIVYAYCGYMFVSNTYINWMDFLIYMPICVYTFRRFVNTGSFWPFAVTMALCVYTCFSIACFAMFIVFPTLVAYGLICVKKDQRKTFIARLCWSFVLAILLALPILFPALSAYLRSARGGDLFENLWKGVIFEDGKKGGVIIGFSSNSTGNIYVNSAQTALYRKLSYIFSDSVFFALTLIWLTKEDWKKPFTKFMIIAGALTMLPVIVDESMLLLNMGSYMSYSLRFGFLNAIYLLGGACLCLDKLCYKFHHAYDGTLLSSIQSYTGEKVTLTPAQTENIQPAKSVDNIETMENVESIQPMESVENNQPVEDLTNIESTQTMETVVLSENTELVETTPEQSEQPKKKPVQNSKSMGNFSFLWAVLMIALGVLAIGFIVWYTRGDKYKDVWTKILDGSSLTEGLKSFASKFAHSLGGLEVVGFICIAVAIVVFVGVWLVSKKKISAKLLSFVLIAVVGVQIVFYNNELAFGNRSTQHTKLTNFQELCEELNEVDDSYFRVKDYADKTMSNATFKGNSNAYSVFSSVIDKDNFIAGELFGYDGNMKNSLKSSHNKNKRNRGDEFGDAFMGYKYFYVPSASKADMSKGELKKYIVPAKDAKGNHIQKDGFYMYENTLVFPTAYRLESGRLKFDKPVNNNGDNRAANQRKLFQFLCGESLATVSKKVGSSSTSYVKPESVRYVKEYLEERSASSVEVGAGKITVRITAEKDGEALFMNFIASKGYKAYVNGKSAKLIDNDLKFLSVALEKGENIVEFEYSSPYVKYMFLGLFCSVAGILALVYVFKKTRWTEVIAPVIYWMAIVLAIALVAFFMLFPTIVAIVKFIYYLILL